MEQLQADVKVHSIQHMEHLMWLKLFQGSICTKPDPDLNPYREKGGGGGGGGGTAK
jgi:hypothetical protein